MGRETRIRTYFDASGLIAKETPQVLSAVDSCAAMVLDHLTNPIRRRGMLEHVLEGSLLRPILHVTHRKVHRAQCPHPASYAGPI